VEHLNEKYVNPEYSHPNVQNHDIWLWPLKEIANSQRSVVSNEDLAALIGIRGT